MPLEGAALRNAVRFVEILRNTEHYTAPQMQAYQRRLLERLVRHAKAEVPFYETRLNPLFGPKDQIRWEAWEDIPIFTRAEAQAAGDALFARNTPPKVGNYNTTNTSGSTGTPLTIRVSAITRIMSAAINQRIFDWHGVDTDASIVFILHGQNALPYPNSVTGNKWNLRNREAVGHQLTINCTVSEQIQWLSANKPNILATLPQNARSIVEQMVANDIPIPFNTVLLHGEALDIETQHVMRDAGIKTIDRFGGEDIGNISANCPTGEGHHQFAEVGLTEFIYKGESATNPSGRRTLVTTPFYSYAMPFIRYENGDQVETTDEPCSCGRTLPRIKRILGRDRNMFTFSDGTVISPNMLRADYDQFLSAKQFQVIQHTLRDIEVIYVADDESRPVDEVGFAALLRKRLNNDIEVRLTRVSHIERGPRGKFEVWKSLL